MTIRLTEYSHGSGCGCKISPVVLDKILQSSINFPQDDNLLVGNHNRDDAAVYAIDDNRAIISTTDFFMPIVDDAFDFGRIAATNALSDVYAMGGSPLMAIAILGWPLDKLSSDVAAQVVDGGRQACKDAGIHLAGGHSIDSPEPIFGLAATGMVDIANLKRNDTATADCKLYLTKPLGIGIYSTAQKKGKIKSEHADLARDLMCRLNNFGTLLGTLSAVKAMTDVTGFGLLGHLHEMCQGSSLQAVLDFAAVPRLPELEYYITQGCSPGGAERNFASYGDNIAHMSALQQAILCDPQTSGGLLVAVAADKSSEFLAVSTSQGFTLQEIGYLTAKVGAQTISFR